MKNNNIRKIAQLAFCSVLMASCSDWTEIESLDIKTPTLEGSNPELYESYLASLREYKASEHKVVIAKFDNKETNPVGQGEHISALPDSIDYVILNNPDNLNPVIESEMEEIRVKKGTKTLYTIDYDAIEEEYNTLQESENKEESSDTFIEFCNTKMDELLTIYAQYKFDGINFVYNGRYIKSLPDDEYKKQLARQEAFFGKISEWIINNQDAMFLFEGKPENLVAGIDLLQKSKFIIIPSLESVSSDELLLSIENSIADFIPNDRYIIGVTLPSITDKLDESGYFNKLDENGDKLLAVLGAADFIISNRGNFDKLGMCVERVQNDYHSTPDYCNIKKAISIMNYLPLK